MIVYGKNVIKEILNSKTKINKIYISKNFHDEKILSRINNINKTYLPLKELNKMVDGLHQGIIIDIEDYKYSKLEDSIGEDLIVILDHLEDPHNFGAIIRTCEIAGIKTIIIPKNRSVEVNSTVMKVSAGALNNIKIVRDNNITNTIKKLKDNGYWIYGTDIDNKSQKYYELDYSSKTVLIIGSEGFGMSRLVKEQCDFLINIPMYGKVNSLNASVAAGITIYEIVKQKKEKL